MRGLGVSLAVCSCGEIAHTQDDWTETYANNGLRMELAAGAEPHNGSFDCRGVEDPWVAHTSLMNDCRHSHWCHSKNAGEASLDCIAVYPWQTLR